MNSAISSMLNKYGAVTISQQKNALKEIIQEIALLGLFRSDFFSKAALYGGSALRIFHGLNRFSEDLDFSLLEPDKAFDLLKYSHYIKNELEAYGFEVNLEVKDKTRINSIRSAFIKTGTAVNLMQIKPAMQLVPGVHAEELLKVKLEVDTDPPADAEYEVKYQLNPVPYSVRLFTLQSIFAGKIHALLFRKWKNRVKGRDFYDYLWFLSHNLKPDMKHLTRRMQQSGNWQVPEILTSENLLALLIKKFSDTDFEQAKKDVKPFLKNPAVLDTWSKEFFVSISEDMMRKGIEGERE
ncbi:MAG: nucleotidyl transferase AbiEii/AbiGii toxin family protein [Candidatus Cloacimonetes bacterium]|nr:nucleotidyl transferase AbiEii/AbiGii toxin family protein [Candidatus Cloacimonadota bacterium]